MDIQYPPVPLLQILPPFLPFTSVGCILSQLARQSAIRRCLPLLPCMSVAIQRCIPSLLCMSLHAPLPSLLPPACCFFSYRSRQRQTPPPVGRGSRLPRHGELRPRWHSPLLVCATGGGGVTPCLQLWLLGCPTVRGTRHICTCLQICTLTCHWCLLGLCCGECHVSLLLCILGRSRAPRLRTSLQAVQASEVGTPVNPLLGWSCTMTTNGMDIVSQKRAQGPCTRHW